MESAAKKISRILVADDLMREDKSQPAISLRLASQLAEPLSCEIHLVHAYDVPKLSVPTQSMLLIEGPYVEALQKAMASEVETMARQQPRLRIVPEVERGKPVDVLLEEVKNHGCELVVLGTHARHGIRRALLGSVAEEFIRRSPVPVFCINPHTELPSDYMPARILVPVDMTDVTTRAVETAAELAGIFGAKIVLATVVEEWVYPMVQSASLLAGGFVMPLERDLQELANLRDSQLRALAEPLRARGLDVEHRLVERANTVTEAIFNECRAMAADLIVIGHRHASRLGYAVLGSVSRQILREAHCPVLVVPPEQSV